MEVPSWLHQNMQEILANELELVTAKRYWAVILGLQPFMDGDQWCVLCGDNIQSGVCGFGASPMLAIVDFDRAWYARQASINRSTDKAPTDDRGEGEK